MTEPLVSVCVITYNSSKYVLETLDSIVSQTYKNIELIISDDSSRDNTVGIVKSWVAENEKRFIKTRILTSEKNTGVTGNCNRAYKAASGVYVKDIGGDDVLLPDYIEKCVDYFLHHSETSVLFTDMQLFFEETEKVCKSEIVRELYNFTPEEQYFAMQKRDYKIPTPAVIYKSETVRNLGYFDERFPMWEDGPMYYKLTKKGIKLEFLDYIGVRYRVRGASLSNKVPYRHKISLADFYFKELMKNEIKTNIFKCCFHIVKFCFFKFSYIPFINWFSDFLVK